MVRVLFQSSPGPKAECYQRLVLQLAHALLVSILTRPEGRVLRVGARPDAALDGVSILTRPEGRVLRLRQNLGRGAALSGSLREPRTTDAARDTAAVGVHACVLSRWGKRVARTAACPGDTPGSRRGASPPQEWLKR